MSIPISVSGVVVRGKGIGKPIGLPTANITSAVSILDGVYYGTATITGSSTVYNHVCSIGKNATFSATIRTFEVHLLGGVLPDFYDSELNVTIIGYIRPMAKFAGVDELITAINNDISIANDMLRPK